MTGIVPIMLFWMGMVTVSTMLVAATGSAVRWRRRTVELQATTKQAEFEAHTKALEKALGVPEWGKGEWKLWTPEDGVKEVEDVSLEAEVKRLVYGRPRGAGPKRDAMLAQIDAHLKFEMEMLKQTAYSSFIGKDRLDPCVTAVSPEDQKRLRELHPLSNVTMSEVSFMPGKLYWEIPAEDDLPAVSGFVTVPSGLDAADRHQFIVEYLRYQRKLRHKTTTPVYAEGTALPVLHVPIMTDAEREKLAQQWQEKFLTAAGIPRWMNTVTDRPPKPRPPKPNIT